MLACTLAPVRTQTRLSATEQHIAAFADKSRGDAESLLERAVNINSGTMNLGGVKRVGQLFDGELKALGFQTTRVEGAPFKRAGHLIAERAGKGPRVLIIGHLDTVFEADRAFQTFTRVNADTARGPGVIDMKGGDVVIVYALKALASAGVLDGMALTVAMTGDEEDPGVRLALARKALLVAAGPADVALWF